MAELMDVIEYLDDRGDTMVQRIPSNGEVEIKWGSQLTVRESQEAIFFRDGKIMGVFSAGRHVLQTQNIPVIGKWVTSFGYGPNSPFRSEVYFVNKKIFTNLKWGTPEPILFRDTELRMIRLRSFGIFSIRIDDSPLFLNSIVGTQSLFTGNNIQEYLKNIIVSKFVGILNNSLKSVLDLSGSYDDLNIISRTKLRVDFESIGISLHDFHINSITFPEEVQRIIDQRSSMSLIGNLDEFMKYKIALSIENSSNNDGSSGDLMGGGVGAGLGLGMGMMIPKFLQNSLSDNSNINQDDDMSSMEKLKKLKELLDLNIISMEEFNEKKNKLLGNI